VERWGSFTPPPVTPNPALDDAWQKLSARWDEPSAHDAFITLARGLDALDGAAARYSRRLREAKDDEPARRALGRVALLAQHAQKNAPRDPLKGARAVFVVSSALAAGIVFVVALVIWKLVVSRP
jgi:hypothetical protein